MSRFVFVQFWEYYVAATSSSSHLNTPQHCNTVQHADAATFVLDAVLGVLCHSDFYCNTLQHTATHCDALQQALNTLQREAFVLATSMSCPLCVASAMCACASFDVLQRKRWIVYPHDLILAKISQQRTHRCQHRDTSTLRHREN